MLALSYYESNDAYIMYVCPQCGERSLCVGSQICEHCKEVVPTMYDIRDFLFDRLAYHTGLEVR